MSYAVEHIADTMGVDDLARQALLSRRTFDRQFRAAAGVSPMQWLLYQRILLAQGLLEDSELSVDDIACQVGLGNGLALRRNFRKVLGVNPQEYRRQLRGQRS